MKNFRHIFESKRSLRDQGRVERNIRMNLQERGCEGAD
jgi:hypothetical protein